MMRASGWTAVRSTIHFYLLAFGICSRVHHSTDRIYARIKKATSDIEIW